MKPIVLVLCVLSSVGFVSENIQHASSANGATTLAAGPRSHSLDSNNKKNELVSVLSKENFDEVDLSLNLKIEASSEEHEILELARQACVFSSDPTWWNTYGPFDGFDDQFRKEHLKFELLLCARGFYRGFHPEYQFPVEEHLFESKLVQLAIECGYTDRLLFSLLALNSKVLGLQEVLSNDGFYCSKSNDWQKLYLSAMKIFDDKTNTHLQYIDFLGGRSLLSKYLAYREILESQ